MAKRRRKKKAKHKEKKIDGSDHPLMTAYLERLEQELAEVPPEQAKGFIAQVRAVFTERLAGIDEPSDKQVLEISARLGQPRALAIEAGLVDPEAAVEVSRSGWILSRVAFVAGLLSLVFTFFSSLTAAILGGAALVLVRISLRHWNEVKKTAVVTIIFVVATAILLSIQLLPAPPTP